MVIISRLPSHRNEISDALHDLVPFAQFKKREKHPWRNDNFTTKAAD